jgi:hypothetical protein
MDAIDALLAYVFAGPVNLQAVGETTCLCIDSAKDKSIGYNSGEFYIRSTGAYGAFTILCRNTGQMTLYSTPDGNTYTKIFEVTGAGNLYALGDISGQSFTDRTLAFTGNALAAIEKIKATKKGEIDHASLPEFAVMPYQDAKGDWWPGRSLGDMVSVLTVAIQQLAASYDAAISERDSKIEELSKRIDSLAAKIA